ncbi:MAG: hypothetical protein ABH804_03200 [archaeon]
MTVKTKAKKTPEQIKEDILNELKEGPKTISEISENINSNWLTIEKFLDELMQEKERKVYELISASKSKVYCSSEDLAFYCLPFKEEVRGNTLSLLHTISNIWRKKTNQEISRTKLQKIAVKLIEDGDIKNVPILNFHYGQTLALRYENNLIDYKTFNLNSKQQTLLSQLIDKYKDWSAHRVQLEQYEKPEMKFYYEKETKTTNLFVANNLKDLKESILKLSSFYPIELKESFEVFDKFVYCVINIINLEDSEELKNYLMKLKEIFTLVWDCLTTEYFFYDAENLISEEKRELFYQIKSNQLNSKIANIETVLNELKEELDNLSEENFKSFSNEKSKELLHSLLSD